MFSYAFSQSAETMAAESITTDHELELVGRLNMLLDSDLLTPSSIAHIYQLSYNNSTYKR